MIVRCALLPDGDRPELVSAIVDGGGELADADDADAIIWTSSTGADQLRDVLDEHPDIRWVQLPFAGVEPFVRVFDRQRVWTCGKGVYAEPVAEHTLALMLGGLRNIGVHARADTWSTEEGASLHGARVCVLGGGGITRSLARLLQPFDVDITVVRRRMEPLHGVREVKPLTQLRDAVSEADVVVLALALTPETERVVDARMLAAMRPHAWLVNVARGRHVDTDALVAALRQRTIGGAALDVTDPEPLPDDHPLWHLDNVIVTPHVASTPSRDAALLSDRVRENVRRFGDGDPLVGQVDIDLGF